MTPQYELRYTFVTMSHLTYSPANITFGGAAISGEGRGYGFGPMSEAAAQALLSTAWEVGIRTYDTAPIYGYGLSEERLGRYLPSEAKIISKGGIDWHSNRRVNLDNRPTTLYRMFDESRTRLQRDQIHAYLIHWPDPRQPIQPALDVLADLKSKKLIEFGGLCNADPRDIQPSQDLAVLDYLQCEYSYLKPQLFTNLYPHLDPRVISMGWGTLAKGILTGRVTLDRKYLPDDARSWAPWWKQVPLKDSINQAQKFLEIANTYQLKPAQLAIWHSWRIGKINLPIVGFKSESDILDIVKNLDNLIFIDSALTKNFKTN